jgi:aldehyde:ferredoxin oxidoreductase
LYGYNGRILRVNLTDGTHAVETPPPSFYRRYAGGRNFGAYYLLNEVPAGADPLGPANKLIFAVSMLTGATFSGQSRASVVGKSPLTGGWGEAEAGGFWPAEFKAAGYDALIIEGVAAAPCYLWIHNGAVELRPAGHIWGKETKEAEEILQAEVGDPKARVAQIGIAGEHQVRFACIVNDLSHFYGRTGLGAVMGAKKLRAIVVRGTRKPELADPKAARELTLKFNKAIPTHPALPIHQALGTPKGVLPLDAAGMLPTRNFHGGSFAGAAEISGERMRDTILQRNDTCYSCATRCKRVVAYDGPEFRIEPEYGGPEYETIGSFGSGCLMDDIKVVAKANELCNKYGMDTISLALTIACAMECFEHGLLTPDDTDGLDLRFGNRTALLACVEKAARREGFGDRLAEGSRRLAARIGGGAPEFAMQIKGQELPAHEPRGKWGVALGYALSPTGADHLNAAHDPGFAVDADPKTSWISLDDIRPLGIVEPVPQLSLGPDKVRLFTRLQDVWSLINVIDFCLFDMVPEFSIYQLDDIVQAVRAVTGWNTSLAELLLWGERGITLARAFNVREGLTAADDTLPDRLFQPLESGAFAGAAILRDEFREAVALYYGMRGWDGEGRPTAARLHLLDLGWLVPLLHADHD